jgi:peptidoglycan/LPS O-acetylase OafA/YrhL
MIQRIQSIWLLLVAACAFATLKISTYAGNLIPEVDDVPGTLLYQEINGMTSIQSSIITIGIGILALVSIFIYSNRKLQTRLCVASFFMEVSLVLFYYFSTKMFKEGSYLIGAILHILIFVFLILAIMGIRKDAKIVEESSRLR